MDFYNEIQDKSSEEVKKNTKRKIEELEREHSQEKENIIGYKVGYNRENHELEVIGNEKVFSLDLRCLYNGYLSRNTKVVYGLVFSNGGDACNDGDYYYLNDDSYIYEFTEYIKDKTIDDDYDIIYYILEFLRRYFGTIKKLERDEMNRLIVKDERTFYPPIREHQLTDFKEKGNALCSEYSTMAQNLMSIMGIESSIVIGNEEITGIVEEPHAFNLIKIKSKESIEYKYFVADFTNPVKVYDENFNVIEITPFLGEIDEITDEFLEGLVFGEDQLIFLDYSLFCFGNLFSKLEYERERRYCINTAISGQKILKKEK